MRTWHQPPQHHTHLDLSPRKPRLGKPVFLTAHSVTWPIAEKYQSFASGVRGISSAATLTTGSSSGKSARASPVSDELLQRVGDLWGRGFSVIPILERGKRPAITWADYQRRAPTMDELGDWFGNGRAFNIGIVTGAVSGIVAIDCDSPEAIAWADAHLPATDMRTRTGRGGEHRFYQHPGTPVRNKVKIQTDHARLALDVRGDGGFVVAPGSVHETGAVYEKLGAWPPVEALPVFDPAWIAEPPIEKPPTDRSPVFSSDHDHLNRCAEHFENGWKRKAS